MTKKLYFAYGANTNVSNMDVRCPAAKPVGRMRLADYRLIFRGVADVEPAEGRHVSGALWWITADCEAALDRFEGYPYHYVKRTTSVEMDGQTYTVMFYVMRQSHGTGEPPGSYEACLREGYDDFGIPQAQIDRAIEESVTETGPFKKASAWA